MDFLERFKKYIAIDTMSDPNSETYPSSKIKELLFADLMVQDLKEIGIEDVILDEYGLVYAHVPNNSEKTIALIAHIDTAPTIKGDIKNPQVVYGYDGGIIKLNETYSLDPQEFSCLKTLLNEDLIVTDGEHLLGGDDKAGIAIIFEFAKYYLAHKDEFKFNLAICFTPDEEVGRGTIHFDLEKMKADYAFTLDGGTIYEANYENFNAASGKLIIKGVEVHPGTAKDIMVNSILVANEFISSLPAEMIPAKTEEYDGFIHVDSIKGSTDETVLEFIIRDHNKNLLEDKKDLIKEAVKKLTKKYPTAQLELRLHDDYRNMKEYFLKDMSLIEHLNKAYLKAKVPLKYTPIRGGTDGANITFLGLPCPNLGVGDFNAHGRFEIVSLTQMKKMVEILKEIYKI